MQLTGGSHFVEGFFKSWGVILASEIGDKTFFIAAVMAMRNSRRLVFAGAMGALAAMTVLSAALGWAAPNLISKKYTHYAAVALFFFFGGRLLWEAYKGDHSGAEELAEVEQELQPLTGGDAGPGVGGGEAQAGGPSGKTSLSDDFEKKDRRLQAGLGLAAASDVVGVTLGGILGHALCTGAAVLGGKHLAAHIEERMGRARKPHHATMASAKAKQTEGEACRAPAISLTATSAALPPACTLHDAHSSTAAQQIVQVSAMLSPKEIYDYLVHAAEQKDQCSLPRLVLLGILSGTYIGLGFTTMVGGRLAGPARQLGPERALVPGSVASGGAAPPDAAAAPSERAPAPPRRARAQVCIGGSLSADFRHAQPGAYNALLSVLGFPLALVLIVLTGGDLFTSNCGLYAPIGVLEGHFGLLRGLRLCVVSYITNLVGCLLMVGLMDGAQTYSPSYRQEFMHELLTKKLTAGWGVVLVRGILANLLVCLAVWLAAASRDLSGKVVGIYLPILSFISMGFEHSVANMFGIPMGLIAGAPFSVGEWIRHNQIPATIGNVIGAGAGGSPTSQAQAQPAAVQPSTYAQEV
eukprot:scaffold12.g8267.t1